MKTKLVIQNRCNDYIAMVAKRVITWSFLARSSWLCNPAGLLAASLALLSLCVTSAYKRISTPWEFITFQGKAPHCLYMFARYCGSHVSIKMEAFHLAAFSINCSAGQLITICYNGSKTFPWKNKQIQTILLDIVRYDIKI